LKEISPYLIQRTAPPTALQVGGYEPWGAERTDFRNYWRLLRKHARLIAAALLASLVLCVGYVITAQTQYTASSTVMIQPRASEIYNVRSAQEVVPQAPPESGEHDYYKTRYELLKSRSLAAHVIRDLKLEQDRSFAPERNQGFARELTNGINRLFSGASKAPRRDPGDADGVDAQLIDQYLSHLSVRPEIGTSLVEVSFGAPSAALSAGIVNSHVEEFIGQEVALRNQASKHAQEYMQQKLSELKRQVEHSEAALNAYRRERGIVTFSLNEKGQSLMERLNELNVDLAKAESTKISLETQHQLIASGDYETLPEVVSNELVQRLKEETTRLASEYASLSNRFNPGYHPLDDLAARLSESQHRLKQEITEVAQSVEANYRASVADEAELKREIEQVKDEAMALNDASLQDSILAREVDTSRDLYKDVLERMSHIRVSSDEPGSDISVVDAARPPHRPSSPVLWLDLSVSLALGLVFGIALGFVAESFDDRVKSAAEIEQLFNLPTLSMVPDFIALGRKRHGYHGYIGRNGSNGTGKLPEPRPAAPAAQLSEIVTFDGRSVVGEAYRSLRAAVMYSKAGGAPKTVLVTSSAPQEGKTVTAINAAVAFAQLSGRVLLVDCDLRRPRCHKVFNLDKSVGLADVLVGQSEYERAVKPTALPNLWLLTAGATVPSPAELLASGEMHQLVQNLKDAYDYVFFDSPPLVPVSDTLALATMVDGVVVVVDANTSRQTVQSTCGRLGQVGAKILGVVLNRVDIDSADYHYHHGDQYHYWYYYHYEEGAGPEPKL
jgi:polysaccharide biosynthesis transport protein